MVRAKLSALFGSDLRQDIGSRGPVTQPHQRAHDLIFGQGPATVLAAADRRGLWLTLLDRLGLGFDS